MKLLAKLSEKGISGIFEVLVRWISRLVNRLLYRWYARLPVEEMLIVLESEGDFCDNAYALYDHMRQNGYLKTYRVCWLVDNLEDPRFFGYENTVFVRKTTDRINGQLMRVLACCKYYIYDHNCLYSYLELQKRPEQKVAYLTHGGGFKAAKGAAFAPPFDVMFVTGPFTAHVLSRFCNCAEEMTVDAGYPRIDYFFRPEDPAREVVRRELKLDRYNKMLLWMPTFRQCENQSISEDYLQNETGLPLVATRQQLQKLDDYLQRKNILLILKVHHLQANLPIFRERFCNLRILKDEHLRQMGVQLYQFVPESDGLITDYSTIAVDYLPLDKPIIYTLDDYEDYARSRGFYPTNAIDYMKGYHVYDTEQLRAAIDEIAQGIDRYQQARKCIISDFFRYTDGNSSERILEHLQIRCENRK